jgi:hypothetical protein
MLGIHVYEKRGHDEYENQMLCVALLSAISWKRYHGKIVLYTNEEYLELLKKWRVDEVYDYIDTTTLKEIQGIDTNDYWAFCKIHVASTINEPFVIIDTDLWIRKTLDFDTSCGFMGLHYEKPLLPYYIDYNQLVPEKWKNKWEPNLLVTNTALLYVNDFEFIKKWHKIAKEIAENDNNKEITSTQKMIFVEQRLLPMLAEETGVKYGTFLKPVFRSQKSDTEVNGWDPPFNTWSKEYYEDFMKVIHVWGLKKELNDPIVRQMVFDRLIGDLYYYQEETEKYKDLLKCLVF